MNVRTLNNKEDKVYITKFSYSSELVREILQLQNMQDNIHDVERFGTTQDTYL